MHCVSTVRPIRLQVAGCLDCMLTQQAAAPTVGLQAFVVLGASTVGAHAAFVLTTGRPLRSAEAVGSNASPQEIATQQTAIAGEAAAAGAAESSSAADASAAAAGESSTVADAGATAPLQTQQLLRQRLQQATAAAQARQQHAAAPEQVSAVNPAAALLAATAMVHRPFDVSRLRMWNPLSGQCVPVRDPACEMREVSHRECNNIQSCHVVVTGCLPGIAFVACVMFTNYYELSTSVMFMSLD